MEIGDGVVTRHATLDTRPRQSPRPSSLRIRFSAAGFACELQALASRLYNARRNRWASASAANAGATTNSNLPIRLKPLQFRSDLFRQRGQVHAFATHLRRVTWTSAVDRRSAPPSAAAGPMRRR